MQSGGSPIGDGPRKSEVSAQSQEDRSSEPAGQVDEAKVPESIGPLPLDVSCIHFNYTWDLRLYVAGSSPRSAIAFSNLKRLCDEHLAGRYQIEVIDIMKNPLLAQAEQIVALPVLVRKGSFPIRKIIGTLDDTERVLASLGIGGELLQ